MTLRPCGCHPTCDKRKHNKRTPNVRRYADRTTVVEETINFFIFFDKGYQLQFAVAVILNTLFIVNSQCDYGIMDLVEATLVILYINVVFSTNLKEITS